MSNAASNAPNNVEYDAIFVGGGASGRFGSCFLQGLGKKPLIVEMDHLGGECHKCRCAFENFVADQAAMADCLRLYSGKSWYPEINLKGISHSRAMKTYRDVGSKAFADAMEFQTVKQLGVAVAWGQAKIIDKNTVEVDGVTYKGKNMVIATGSRPMMPGIKGDKLENVWTYRDHPNMTWDPKKIVLIGGGKIGMGKASMFAPFGIDVTVLEKYTCMPKWDADVREFVFRNMKMRGIKIHEGVEVKEILGKTKVEGVKAIVNGKEQIFECDAVMITSGLTPNSEIAKQLGVEIGRGNEIVVNDKMETSVPGVYAVGDVAGPPFFMACARKEGMTAAKNICGEEAVMDYDLLPDHTYISPLEATMIGLTEAEARAKYKNVICIKVPAGERPPEVKPEQYQPGYAGNALPVCGRMHTLNLLYYGANMNGMLKAVVNADTREYVGFHHVGDGAKVAFQYLGYLMKKGWKVDDMAQLNEVFLNAEHFIQLSRLIAGKKKLTDFK